MLLTSARRVHNLVLLSGAGSAALLLSALFFQYLGGMFPCELCIWQRWPHLAAVFLACLYVFFPELRVILFVGALAALTTSFVGFFHVGVEQGWWQGLASCSGGGLEDISLNALLNPGVDVAAPVRCDQVPWLMAGVSMAGWNAFLSLVLASLWMWAFYSVVTRP